MALTLTDFNKSSNTEELRMNAFQPTNKPAPNANSATINTMASYGAALAPQGEIDNTYFGITNQLKYGSSSSTLDAVLQKWDEDDIAGSMNAMKEILVDPSLTDEYKQQALTQWQINQSKDSLSQRVATASAIAENPGENGEQEDMRIRLATAYNEVDEYNAWVQKSINALNSENNPQWTDHIKSMVESFIPFTDAAGQAFFEDALNVDDTGGLTNSVQTLLMLGEGRERLRTTLANIPLEERRPIVQNIINTIKATSGTRGATTVAMKQIANLEQMLVPGAYGDKERWADNIFSVMDDMILLSPIRKGLGALRGVVKGADGARVAEATIARAERSAAEQGQLLLEYKPAPVSYGDDIDRVIDNLPGEPTSVQIKELREAAMTELSNPNGFNIDNVIDRMSLTDNLTASEILDVRQQLGPLRDKRINDINGSITFPEPNRITTEEVITKLPVEPTKAEIDDLRTLIESNATTEDIINNAVVVDKMNAEQIRALRADLADVQISGARRVQVSSNIQPTAVSQVYVKTNPSKARIANAAVSQDRTDNAARILYGTDRDSALANDFLPEIGGDGRLRGKVEFDEAMPNPDKEILDKLKRSDGAIWADSSEKAAAGAKATQDWKNAVGISNRSSMAALSDLKLSATTQDDGVRFAQVFGPSEGGFSNAITGTDTVKSALRKYGISDNEITILSRQKDGSYAPASPTQDLVNGDFLIRVDHDYKFDPKDIAYQGFEVGKLWGFIPVPDVRVPGVDLKQGGVLQQVVPKAVNIDIRAYGAGISAADKSAGLGQQLLKYQKRMLDKWKKLPASEKNAVDKYIRDANEKELKFNTSEIRARGISDDGIEMLNDWKTVQDTQWVLENRDVNRTFRQRGYELFEHRPSDTKLIVEPQSRASNVHQTRYYDPTTDKVRTMTNEELDELYAQGGTTAKLRKPEIFAGDQIEYVISRNTPNGGYSRRIRDDDQTLGYRNGYYHVRYNDPYYVVKIDPKTKTRSVIARAETRRDAELEATRLGQTKDGFEYDWKPDDRANPDLMFDNNLDVAFSSGRSTQRLRGKRLERVGTDKTIGDMGLESPIDSLTRSIHSIANRTSFRNVIEADKRRWLSQFKHLMPNDAKRFPKNVDEIRGGSGANDARNAYRYIEGLQDGYANLIDDASKAFFAKVSDTAGKNNWGWLDKVARKATAVSPSATARLTAFRLFLASNPHGQFILQAAPAIPVISSTNPLGWKKVIQQMGILGAFHRGVDVSTTMKVGKFTGLKPQEMRELLDDYELSGMSSAVNAHSYIAEQMGRLADRNVVQQVAGVAGAPLRLAQTVGFDFGEQTLMSLVWLSERDRLTRRLGRNKLTASEREELTVRVRAMTGDMNKGGEMPYNSNTFSVIMQFLQSPHKISSGLILGHKGLTGADRAKLAAGYTLAFGVPGIPIINSFVDKIMPPDNPELKEVVKGGLTNIVLNKSLSSLTGEDVGVDFSGRLQPFSLTPLVEFASSLLTLSIPEMISNSAAPSLIADGGRVGEFIKAVAAPFIPGNYEGVDEYKQVGISFMQMFTGMSNTMKALYMSETGKITTRSGQVVDDDISYMETLAKAAGFSTLDEARYWESNKIEWETSDQIDNDVKQLVDELFVLYTRQGDDITDFEANQRVIAEASRVFGGNIRMMKKVADYYSFKAKQNPDALYSKLFKGAGLYDPEDAIRMINASNMSQDQIDTLLEMYNIAGESYGN